MRTLLIVLILAAFPVMGQAPRSFFPWWDSPIVKDLNLTDDQSKQIRTIVREYRSKLIDQRAALEKSEIECEETFNEEAFDMRRANDALEHLIAARGELTRSLSQMGLRLRAVLTSEQFRELQKRRPSGRPGQMLREEFQRRKLEDRRLRQPGGGNPPPPHQNRQ